MYTKGTNTLASWSGHSVSPPWVDSKANTGLRCTRGMEPNIIPCSRIAGITNKESKSTQIST